MLSLFFHLLQSQVTGESKITRFKFLQSPENWIIVLIVLGIILFSAIMYRKETGTASKTYKYILGTLRILTLIVILFLMFEPIISTELSEIRNSYVAVLIDDSLSMSFRDVYSSPAEVAKIAAAVKMPETKVEEATRIDLVKRLLSDSQTAFIDMLLSKNSLKLYTFSSGLREFAEAQKGEKLHIVKQEKIPDEANPDDTETTERVTPQDIVLSHHLPRSAERRALASTPQDIVELFRSIEANGKETKLGDCLNEVLKQLKGQRIAGIVIISDGRNNRGTLKPETVAETAGLKKIPIYTVSVGNPEEPKDIILAGVDAREVVLAGDKVTFTFTLKSTGFEGETATISLKLDDTVVATKQIVLIGKNQLQRDDIVFKPSKEGDFIVTLSVHEKPGEHFKDNNSLTFNLRVVDEKIKVLYIDGEPRWEYRYLKTALVRDNTIKVQCILQAADDGFPQESSPGIAPLAAFPVTKKELFDNYHVIIIGDVDTAHPRHSLSREQLEWINEFVLKMHGGVLFIAGENYNPNSYKDTPLSSLLSVEGEYIGSSDVWGWSESITQSYHLRLTPDGKESLIMRLEPDIQQNIELWEDNDRRDENSLPGLFWYYPAKKAKPNIIVLAVHPTDKNDQGEWRPIIAYSYCGSGISMFVGIDETWRWRAGVGDKYFYRFYSQAIRFLSTRIILGKTKRHSLSTADGKTTYFLSEKVDIVAKVYDRDYNLSTQPVQSVCIEEPGGNRRSIELTLNEKRPGEYLGSITPTKVGLYKVWIGTLADPKGQGLAFATFSVEVPTIEKKDPRMNKELLQQMAKLSGGHYYEIYQLKELPNSIQAIQETISSEVSEDPLWNRWQILLLFTALITAEWIGRKMRKLV
ncbi:MAG: hypothetical protein ABIH42_03425 [Planctomycetota bacterium]